MTAEVVPPAGRGNPFRSQFALFVFVGGTAATLNFGSRVVFSLWMDYGTAIVLAYLLGMVTAFILNRALVFRESKSALHQQIMWFILVNFLAILQTLAISFTLAKWLMPSAGWTWQPELCAHAAGVSVPIFTSYLGHRALTFK